MTSKMPDDLDLKDAIAILARVIERTEQCRDAVKRRGLLDGVDTSFLVLGAEQEIAALNLAMATMLLARGRIDDAAAALGVTPPAPETAPKPAPVAPWPHGAEVEPAPRVFTRKPVFRPAPVPPRTRTSAPEIAF